MKLLVLDNYDSFTYNLVHLIEKVSDISFDVVKNDQLSLTDIAAYHKILLSPGPGLPSQAGIMPALLREYAATKSVFGVCLGLQAIGEAFGATLMNLDRVYHGLSMPVKVIENDLIFDGCPASFNAGRYHSWVIDAVSVPHDLVITAVDEQNLVMAVKHRKYDVRGVQFHPESILSEHGEKMIANWLRN